MGKGENGEVLEPAQPAVVSHGFTRGNVVGFTGGASNDTATVVSSKTTTQAVKTTEMVGALRSTAETMRSSTETTAVHVTEGALALKSEASVQIDRRAEARIRGYEGEACGECGNFTLVRNGTCLKCDTCGGTSGCS
jgi:ribonucleoside-diphosphate reductase alpha chain